MCIPNVFCPACNAAQNITLCVDLTLSEHVTTCVGLALFVCFLFWCVCACVRARARARVCVFPSSSSLLLLLFVGLIGFWCCLFHTRDAICRLSSLLSMWRHAHTWLYTQRVIVCVYFAIYSPCDVMVIVLSAHHVTLWLLCCPLTM